MEGLGKLGLSVSFGKHVEEENEFKTTTVEHRLEDLHEAYADPNVQAIIPARGGWNSEPVQALRIPIPLHT